MQTIVLSNGREAKVSDEDYERLAGYKWFLKGGYACRYIPVSKRGAGDWSERYMHHDVLWIESNGHTWHTHHKDRDRLNNQRENLKIVSCSQHRREHAHEALPALRDNGPRRDNTSGYKGVAYHRRWGKWVAQLKWDGKNRTLGYFPTAEEAALAYDAAVIAYLDPGCYTNLVPNGTPPRD